MAGSPDASDRGAGVPANADVLRFTAGSRTVHWVHAAPFLFLLLSGLSLFIPPLKAVHIDGYRLVPLLHVLVGIAFTVSPLPVYLTLQDRARVGDDLRRLFRLDQTDAPWARYAVGALLGARVRPPLVGKFNFGQKLNTLFTVLVTGGLMLTGAVLAVNFFSKAVFSARFVERVFPLHDLFMLIALPVVVAHIYLGGLHPSTRESLRGITRGRVRLSWARAHHLLWVDEVKGKP